MSESQKEQPVITNNQSDQHNQGSQENQENRKKNGDVSENPAELEKQPVPAEVPNRHHTKEQEEQQPEGPGGVDGSKQGIE